MKETIALLLEQVQLKIDEIEEVTNEDFNACDASGGNFDDAYELGYDHGYEYGKRAALKEMLSKMS
ncbi:hypothetical protein BC351_01215 [Paenibacillus ferrarius]|uniref:Uncharacterized protein n=1 Tax=Paenibacillus ferrarius TaxID=1469647 RepID=A0A1V4HSJ2_9BACL|nr:hypothetical protein [Paenibacillus ferrarius]OPH61890.1 hypothetical protein BC351_01215 [Paenibacillus ferrarius]